ncbi:MAG: tRNA lysidine(34) synthetase TilS [Thermodesulfobacteriota bacterium]
MENLHPIEKKVLSTIREHHMISRGDKIIVAVSGGPDSVCLLEILFRLQELLHVTLLAAHLDHGLRPGEDQKETEFVEILSRRLGIPCAVGKASQLEKTQRNSLEQRARESRYTFLEELLRAHQAQRVALGHNKNDQVETVLMNLLRGAGLAGLSGIPPVRGSRYIRPLISITRKAILAYVQEKGLSYMTDSSNLEKDYLRNRIRLELIPALSAYQPRLLERIDDLAFICRQENRFMEEEAEKHLTHMILTGSEGLNISLKELQSLPLSLQHRVIRAAIQKIKGNLRKIHLGHIRAILELIENPKPQADINLPGDIIVKKRYALLRFSLGEQAPVADFSYTIEGTGWFHLEPINCTITCEEIVRKEFNLRDHTDWQCFLDLESLGWPLIIRNVRPGDTYMPLGLNGFKKVKDIFIDHKIPREERKRIPILESQGDIVWIGGMRIDHRHRVREDTKRILRCKIE